MACLLPGWLAVSNAAFVFCIVMESKMHEQHKLLSGSVRYLRYLPAPNSTMLI